jgi:butyryl-CoA dehydrogenase
MSGDKILSGIATDPTGQSNGAEWGTFAVRQGDEYVLNGTRLYGTNNLADIAMILGFNQDREMKAYFIEKGTPGFDNSNVAVKYGMAGQGGGTSVFKDCHIPIDMACNAGIGDSQFYYRIYNNCAAEALGCAEGILEKTIEFCKNRTHDFKPLTNLQVVAQKLGYLRTRVDVAHSAVYDAATMFEELCKNPDPALEREWGIKTESIKLYVSETAVEVATECIKLHGGLGYHSPDLYHYVGDAMCYCIMDLSNDIHWDNLAMLMGLTEA